MTDRQTAPETVEESPLTVALLALAALGWTGAMLWSARATITGRDDAAMEVTSTAYALPGAVSADLVAGAAVALLALTLLSARRPLGASARFAVATGAGLLTGLVSALPIITINTAGTMYAIVGGTVAAAATIGGALAGLRIPPVIAAAAAGAVGVFLVGFLLNLFQDPVLEAYGAGDTASSADAAQWFSYSQAALSGLAAGLIPFALLRRARRRTGADLRWPLYALAGAGAGLIIVIAELLARTAGAQVLELAGKVSELELVVQEMLSSARLNNGLIVLFVGAFTALVAVGRTISPADSDPASPAAPRSTTPEDSGTTTPADSDSASPADTRSTSRAEPGATARAEPGATSPAEPGAATPAGPGSTDDSASPDGSGSPARSASPDDSGSPAAAGSHSSAPASAGRKED
ncbi:hypothetical protein [Actinoplanes utahensis]|uniref:hypothetical protein n=1 Tax=Actinoplanes utahensis TaxID=1869 RepID=UPI000A076E8F|nr:hypothetical protein [Actinoplanes utahensis]GIF28130.1 hypothetical protein Aut01nite_11160 [Actinoplanes utahensis]